MIVRIHGFNWHTYTQKVMPALSNWLLEKDENSIYQMYQQTRCAQEEQCLPPPLQTLCTWTRAQSFVKQVPLSTHARREYEHLCSPERFTAMSDRYVYRHPPQLIQTSEALSAIWGALIETYCLPWLHFSQRGQAAYQSSPQALQEPVPTGPDEIDRELLRLLQVGEVNSLIEETDDEIAAIEPTGVVIGRLPTTLHIRGWLAAISVRAMALFELLACERRSMPFGYQPGTPFSSYAGYLTPDEVQQLALCLHNVEPPNQAMAVVDYQQFRQQAGTSTTFRMIDEVLPLYADTFVTVTRLAAQQGVGLICSIG
jgi:hypothetical protein